MLIDFHTHVFPEAIAQKTIDALSAAIKEQSGIDAMPCTNGTVTELLDMMDRSGVSISVTMPVATKPSQVETINSFSKSIRTDRIFTFGAIHPDCDDVDGVMERIKADGFCGVKIHPEFQGYYINSPEYMRILRAAERLGLYVLVHAGSDVGKPPPVHCRPEMVKDILDELDGSNIILAHMGGFGMWDDVEKYLVGTNVKMDTAVVCRFMEAAQCRAIIEAHGSDKVLFGSDCPWSSPAESDEYIRSLGLSSEDEDKVRYKNAMHILGLE